MSKKEVRMARQAALLAKRARERLLRIGAIAGVIALAIGAVIWLVVARARQSQAAEPVAGNVTATEIELPYEGALHIPVGQTGTYQHYPPSSGPHWNQPSLAPVTWGAYRDSVRPEQWIHNLEHGGIVILYNCPDGCPDTVAALEKFARRVPNSRFGNQKVVVSPNSEITSKIVALAWTRELDLSDFDRERLLEFYKRWVDTGTEQVP